MNNNQNKDIALVFDVDGTLWDATQNAADSWSLILQKYTKDKSLSYSHEFITSLMGKPMDYIGDQLTPKSFNPDEKKPFIEECFTSEVDYLLDHPGKLFPNEEETLIKLKELGYTLFIVSNCQLGYVESYMQGTGMGKYFSGHMCFGDTLQAKHVTIDRLLNKYGYKKAIYIGDTLGDENETHILNLPFIFASWGFGECSKPEFIAKSYEDLIEGVEIVSKSFYNK